MLNIEKYADVMIFALKSARKNGKFKPGENILLSFDYPALNLAEAIYHKQKHKKPLRRIIYNPKGDFI